ncbi:MAG: (2Fe-2S) ferredoxin domain-containing protein [Coleofasciculaceae cyanobacterium]
MDIFKKEGKVSKFFLEGRFIRFVSESGEKPKRILVETLEGERSIKLSKELREELGETLQPGDLIEISGKQKIKNGITQQKLKAYEVKLKVSERQQRRLPPSPNTAKTKATPKGKKACVMVCQKSSCRKRGASDVCQAVTESLQERGLENHVIIQTTGCMKQCKKGPVMVLMPDKSLYTKVASDHVGRLVEKHFACKLKSEVV